MGAKLNACPGLKKSFIVTCWTVVSPFIKKQLFVFVAAVGLIITPRMLCPTTLTLVGISKGNISSYSPGNICISTGPCILASALASAALTVRIGPCTLSPTAESLPFLLT